MRISTKNAGLILLAVAILFGTIIGLLWGMSLWIGIGAAVVAIFIYSWIADVKLRA